MLQISSAMGTSCTLAGGEILVCMEGTEEGKQAALSLSDKKVGLLHPLRI